MDEHQDKRIERMEATVMEYTLRVSQQSTQLEYLQTGMDDLGKRFEKVTELLNEKLEKSSAYDTTRDSKVQRLDSRIKELEQVEEAAKQRKRLFKAVLLSVFTALGGAFATKIMDYFSAQK